MKLYSLMMWTLLLRTFQPPQWHVLDWIQWMRTRSYWTRSAVWQAATGHSTAHHNTETAKQHWSVTCAETEMSQDPAVAATVCEHLVRLKSLISALNNKPARGEIQHKREPGNKKVVPQCYFASTKKETKRKPECWCCKRHCHRRNTPQTWPEAEGLFPCTKRRANQRLASLSNQTEVVSQGTAGTDHDYHVMLLQMKYCALHSVVDFAAIYTVYLFTLYASPLILFVYPMHWIDPLISFFRRSVSQSVCLLTDRLSNDYVRNSLPIFTKFCMRLRNVVASTPIVCDTNRK